MWLVGQTTTTFAVANGSSTRCPSPKIFMFFAWFICCRLYNGVGQEPLQNKNGAADDNWCYKAVFGLPWECEQFIRRAVEVGHPSNIGFAVPKALQIALDKHLEWDEQTWVQYRMHWCRKWLKRAKELESAELEAASARPDHVKQATAGKRLLLTSEILESMDYVDMEVLELLRVGSPLAGDIPKCKVFEDLYKPC